MSRVVHSHVRRLSLVLFVACNVLLGRVSAESEQTADLTLAEEAADTRSRVVLEVDGELIPDGSADKTVKLKAVGDFLYQERILSADPQRVIRYYEQAKAEVAVGGTPETIELRENRRYVIVEPEKDASYRAIEGALSRKEVEMIEVPGGSHLIDQMLPGRIAKLAESWGHSDDLLAELLNLDTVNGNDVKTQLKSLEGSIAHLESSGKVLGSIAGSTTEIQLSGKLRFDVAKHCVTWAALGIEEEREAGPTSPGLKVRARLRLLREPTEASHLSETTVKSLMAADSASGPYEFQPASGLFHLTHDRRWHLYRDHADLTVFRLIEDGKIIAHCNLRQLPPMPVGQQLELVGFQKDVREALGTAARQIVDATEGALPNQTRQLRISVVGEASGLPIQWIYYHLDNAENRRLSCVFTMNAADAEKFGAQDATFVSGINLDTIEEPESVDEVARKP